MAVCLIAFVAAAPPALFEEAKGSDLEQNQVEPIYVVSLVDPEDSDLDTAASAQYGGYGGRGGGFGGGFGGGGFGGGRGGGFGGGGFGGGRGGGFGGGGFGHGGHHHHRG